MTPIYYSTWPTWYANSSTATATTSNYWPWRVDASSTASTGTVMGTVWPMWVSSETATSATVTIYSQGTLVWPQWATARAVAAPALSPEQLADLQEAARERTRLARERIDIREKEAAAAKVRAKETLVEFLSPSQRDEYQRVGRFHCEDRQGKRYAILPRKMDNVIEYNGAVPAGAWCVHEPGVQMPVEDTMLAQKLAIECGGEEELRQVAHKRPYRVGDLVGVN